VLHVPMILAGPGLPAGRRVAPVAPNTALAPTLLAVAGMTPLARADTSDLAKLWREAAPASGADAYAETLAGELDHGWAPLYGVRSDRWHYIRAPRPELFDLAADPRQRKNLLPSEQPEHVAVVKAADARIDALLAHAKNATPQSVDAETRAQIEALGYVVPDGRVAKTGADPKDVHRLAGVAFDALALLFAKRHEEAEKLALRGLEAMPGSSQLHDILARIYLDMRKPAQALPHALEAAKLNPGVGDFHAQVAYVYLVMGQLPDAVAAFERTLQVDPTHPGAHVGVMWRAKLGGTIEEAAEHAEQALAHGGERGGVVERVGEVWENLGQYDRALAVYERGAKEFPEQPSFHMRLAIQYARFGDEKRAEQERASAGTAATDVNLRNRLAIAYAARREFERAEPIFREILKERPDEPATRRFLARMLRETGREAEAAELVEGVSPAHEVMPPAPPTDTPARG
jgi:choline-sulfatase